MYSSVSWWYTLLIQQLSRESLFINIMTYVTLSEAIFSPFPFPSMSEIPDHPMSKSSIFFLQNAYTATAINSTNFCTSAKDAFVILVENALRVAAINTVGDFMLFLGKVCPLYTVVMDLHSSKLSLAMACTSNSKCLKISVSYYILYHI